MKYCLYILKSLKNNQFYIGQTNNLDDRLLRHNRGETKSTRSKIPWIIVYKKEYASRKNAVRKEKYLKSQKSRKLIEKIIAG